VLFQAVNANHVNHVVNRPDVRPFCGGIDDNSYLDLSEAVKNPKNITLECGGGYFIFVAHGTEYEIHCSFMEGCRGKYAVDAALDAMNIMFEEKGATKLFAEIPVDNKRTCRFASHMGMKRIGQKELTAPDGWTYLAQRYELEKV